MHVTSHLVYLNLRPLHLNTMTDLTGQFQKMGLAVFIAYRALRNGETPVACLLVHESTGKILSFGCNDTNRSLNGTRHAEFVAIDKILEEYHLLNRPSDEVASFFLHVALYVTIEPCVMCALALQQLGIKKVYFGAANDRFGGNGTVIKVQGNQSYQSYGGILRVEAIHLLRNFYIQENDSAPVPKVKKNKDIEGKKFPENLSFFKYLSEEDFIQEYGDARFAQFYRAPNRDHEITPQFLHGYSFNELLSKEAILSIPKYFDLYPGVDLESINDVQLLNDIETLAEALPKITLDGKVDYDNETKKRKLEAY